MEERLYNAVNDIFKKIELVSNKARRNSMAKILPAMIKSKQVQFHSIAVEIKSDAQNAPIKRRIQAFFKRFEFDFDFEKAGLALLSFLPPGKLDLSIDRTEWNFGKRQCNFLYFNDIG
jgi:hypothetical protein